ncbi:hypothetical protein D0T84_11080 [Dysgonomonas sp. 521]|uniref:hypothetical protein n=1 Tax=Dysgonomonas sp. 521 TaxID=2302932 RepID=UPI0013D52AA5|nr:hypothetical protein [Dysgonomonas sp. 521]NDV95453.1 hypothetical protein [Dysgonomonas sp. 521]
MQFFRKNPCKKFFTYSTRTLDIKGLSANMSSETLSEFNLGIGQISIKPEYIEATNKLQELDLLQYTICNNIHQLDDKDPEKATLLKKLIETQIEMLKIAQNPEKNNTVEFNNSSCISSVNAKTKIEALIEQGDIKAVLAFLRLNLQDSKNIVLLIAQFKDIDDLVKTGVITKLSPEYREYVGRLRLFINDLQSSDFKI